MLFPITGASMLLANAKQVIAIAIVVALVGMFGYAKMQSYRADAAVTELDGVKADLIEAQDIAQHSIDEAARLDKILAEREAERAATQKKLDSARRRYKEITQERANDTEDCLNRPIGSDISDWMLNSAAQD